MAPRRKTLAEQLNEAANPEPKDYDPEDLEAVQHAGSDSDSSDNEEHDRTSHYVPVDRSKLRDDGIALSEGKYKGSKVSRHDIESEEEVNDEEGSEEEGGEQEGSSKEDGSSDEEGSSDEMEEDVSEGEEPNEASKSEGKPRNNEVSQILSAEQKHLLSQLNKDRDTDVEKGKAVSAQIKIYEGLLDMRIQVQKILNETNKLSAEDPQDSSSLHPLIDQVLQLRCKLNGDEDTAIPQNASSLTELADQNQKLDEALAKKRESVLTKWSRKVELSSGKNALQSNRFRSLGQSAALQVNTTLGDMDRLEKRTKVDRSNYGLDESHPWLYDDTDFYRLLLKDLVDRRMADSSAANGIKWKAAASVTKQKKNVDTKASKGRKLRYNVIEKIQGFDAPRNVFTWSDKQAEDLYSGLLGVKLSMDDAEDVERDGDDSDVENVRVTEEFNLFG